MNEIGRSTMDEGARRTDRFSPGMSKMIGRENGKGVFVVENTGEADKTV